MPLTPDEEILFKLSAPLISKEPVIFDVGAYKGAYTDFVLSVVPGAACWLFEPNTDLYSTLIGKGYNAFGIIISNTTGFNKVFYKCSDNADELSSIYKRTVFDQENVKVGVVKEVKTSSTIDYFCELKQIHSVDFLKIDVEGAELDVLHGAASMLSEKKITFLQVEYGGTYPDAGITFMQVIEFVNQYGYKVYELIDGKISSVTKENFVEDYRFANFLITHIDI